MRSFSRTAAAAEEEEEETIHARIRRRIYGTTEE